MSDLNSTARQKPAKPYPEFPLFAHATGRWAKKIRGSMHYFGQWDDPDAALTKYLDQKDALHAGKRVRSDPDALTVNELTNHFLNAKQALVDTVELSPRTWAEYNTTTDLLVANFGKQRLVSDLDPQDFAKLRSKMARKWGPHRLAKIIQYVRSVFKHGFDAGLIERPVRFGPGFNRPSKKTIRLQRAEQGLKLFSAQEIRELLGASGIAMRAMGESGNGKVAVLPALAPVPGTLRTADALPRKVTWAESESEVAAAGCVRTVGVDHKPPVARPGAFCYAVSKLPC